jgi:hypothetical protein
MKKQRNFTDSDHASYKGSVWFFQAFNSQAPMNRRTSALSPDSDSEVTPNNSQAMVEIIKDQSVQLPEQLMQMRLLLGRKQPLLEAKELIL